MLALLLFCILGWLFSIAGWKMEANYRRKIVDLIKKDIEKEIRWINLNNYEDVMAKEMEVYKRVIGIVEDYNYDKKGVEDEEDNIQ